MSREINSYSSTSSDDPRESSANSSLSNSLKSTTFTDYTPPPKTKILPPAKYKLWLIIFILVYFAVWVSDISNFVVLFRFGAWLSPGASLFLQLGVVVFVLTFSTLELFITCFTFKLKNGKVWGVGPWLRQPRAKWVYNHDDFFHELSARILHILEDGFSMFDAPPLISDNKPKKFYCKDGECERTLKIEHRIKTDELENYRKWEARIARAAGHAEGLIKIEKTGLASKESIDLEVGATLKHSQVSTSSSVDHQYQAVYIKFENIDYLNEWMSSPRREALMIALEPMLFQPDEVQIQSDRELPDAFSDLLARQGRSSPKKPPQKWKVCWLTLLSLFLTIHWTSGFLPYYFDKWGVTKYNDARIERLISVFVATFLNSYITTPLFSFVFDYWLHNKQQKFKSVRQPWKAFDYGFKSFYIKILVTFIFYGGCLIAYIVKKLG